MTRRTKEEVGRQHQEMDRPGVRQVPEGSGEQGKMEKTGCKIICGAPTTLAVKGLMMIMMMACLRHTVNRQHKMQQLELSQNIRRLTTSRPFSDELLHFYTPSRPLRSDSRSLLNVPRPRISTLKRYGHRAFRYAAPSLWNALPGGIRERDSIQSFKASLKTHFFNCN